MTRSDDRSGWLLLAVVSLASFPVVLGDTALSVALPAVASDLKLGFGSLPWLANSYTLALAVVLLPAGRLAELLQARSVFLAGIAVFALASLAAALVPNAELLFGARALQGSGAALVFPASLAIITRTFPAARSAVGVAVWTAVLAAGVTLGPFVGAILTAAFGWRALFLADVLLAAATLALAARVIPRASARARAGSFDVAGTVTLSVGLVALLYPLASGHGFRLLVLAAAPLFLFAAIERRSRSPLADLRLFRSRAFLGANTVNLLLTAVVGSVFFFTSLYLQIGLGYSLLAVSVALTPMTALTALVPPVAAASSDRWGARAPMTAGLLVVAAALVALARFDARPPLTTFAATLATVGLGIGLASAPITAAALADVPAAKAASGAAVLTVFRTIGLTLGVGAMGAVATRAGAHAGTAQSLRDAFSTGMLASAAVAVAAAAVAYLTIGERRCVSAGCGIAAVKPAVCVC
jgi:EmrB/QacA subfamily drug resistance transporter